MKKFVIIGEPVKTNGDKAVLQIFPDGKKRMRFDAVLNFGEKEAPKFDVIKNADGVIVDYQNVTLKGYLSTWQHVTPSDRDGDYVQRGAFAETIPYFMKNPVMLANHSNNVAQLVGKFTTVKEDEVGLYVEGLLSNSPSEFVKDVRFKVAEGSLRTMSMGGVFHYHEDGRGIFKVSLWEGSLTPVPANQDAIFSVRELTDAEIKKVRIELGA